MSSKTGVLLINLGTPDSPATTDVRRYLTQFLNDPRVIDIPWLARKLLVNGIIVPFRAPKSAKIYRELWTEKGSPLLYHSQNAGEKLAGLLGPEFEVELAMRYQQPGIPAVLAKMEKKNYRKIIILPMFPQYASASTGSALEEALNIIRKWWVIPEITCISEYFQHDKYIAAFTARGLEHNLAEYDHVLFSYHGLPERQVEKTHQHKSCSHFDCENSLNGDNYYCYRAQCYATTRALAARLQLQPGQYTVAFQSRLDNKWLRPFSDKVVEEAAKKGIRRLLVFSPAFTADCLETTIEIAGEYREIFRENGGEHLQLVESLNDHPLWIETMRDLVLSSSAVT